MDPTRYQTAVERFEQAVELPRAARAALLARLDDDDPELALLVRRMLLADDEDWEPPAVADQLALDMLDDRLEPGAQVGGFTLEDRLGAGGMAAVWRAVQERPQRRVALKILHAWQRDPLVLDRFRFEADALARLRHPAFPEVYAVGEEDGRPWIAMELVEGTTLNRWLADALPGPADRLRALIALVEAAAGLHALGLVHRDLKPANVLISGAGEPRVVDLGVASADDDAHHIRHMAVGTPGWSSPEQGLGAEALPSSDVYALGVIGRLLLLGARGAEVPPGVPIDVVPILDRATDELPARRYADAAALADELRRARDGLPVVAVGGGAVYRARRWAGRHARALRAVAVLAGVLLVAGLTAGLDRWLDQRAALRTARQGLEAAIAAGQRGLPPGTSGEGSAPADQGARSPDNPASEARRARGVGEGPLRGSRPDASRDPLAEANIDDPGRAWAGGQVAPRGPSALDGAVHHGAEEEECRVHSLACPTRVAAERSLAELRSFLALPESAPVAWEGWLLAADAAHAAHALEAELEALGMAWGASAGPAEEGEVLQRSVDALLRRWSFTAALAAARHAGDRLPAETRARLHMLAGDLPAALALMPGGDPRAPLVRALARATPTAAPPLQITTAGPDGRLFAVDAARDEIAELGRAPDLPVLRRWPTGDLNLQWLRVHLVDLGEVYLLAPREHQPKRLEALRLDPGGLTPVGAWPEARVQRVAVSDGQQILLGTGPYDRHLVQIDPRTWTLSHPSSDADFLQSDLMDLHPAQLDDDAEDEVIVGFGPWWAYGALRLDRSPTGTLHRTAMAPLGFVHDIDTLRTPRGLRVVALKSDRYPEPNLFGEAQPFGPQPAGVHLLRPDDLSIDVHLALPPPLGHEGAEGYVFVHAGDLDGDGLEDLAVWVDHDDPGHTWLLRQLPNGGFAELLLAGLRPLATTDLDGDGDDELVVLTGDGASWVLGAGDAPPPTLRPSTDHALVAPPALRTSAAREAWTDAEVLRELGLVHAAAAALLRAADHALAGDSDLLAVRSGRLAEAAGDLPLALSAFQRGLASADVEALRGLHRVARGMVDLDAALDAAQRLRAVDPAWQAEVDHLLALRAAPTVRWSQDGGLPDEAWHARPAAVRRVPEGLDVAVLGGQGTVLSLPLRGDGARVGLRARFDLTELDPGVELEIDVTGPFGLLVGVLLGRDGRTGAVRFRCRAAGIDEPAMFPARELVGPSFEVEVQRLPDGVACSLTGGGKTERLQAPSEPVDLTPTTLVIRDPAAGDYGVPMSTLARIVLRAVEVDGATLAATPPPPADPADARIVAALREGGDVAAALARRPGDPSGTLRLLLRTGTPSEVERLRLAMSPEAFADLVTSAWSGTLYHAPAPQVLAHLDQPWLHTITPTTEARALLLGRVALALASAGRHTRAASLLAGLTEPQPLALLQPMVGLDLLLSRARVAAVLGEEAVVADALRQARAATPLPELVERRVAADPVLAGFQ